MTVYVDSIRHYPDCKLRYKYWCHLTTDGDLDELHEMADKIGMKRAWFQNPETMDVSLPHYDLIPTKRALALKHGAQEATRDSILRVFAKWKHLAKARNERRAHEKT